MTRRRTRTPRRTRRTKRTLRKIIRRTQNKTISFYKNMLKKIKGGCSGCVQAGGVQAGGVQAGG
jgi:hypothetical protein